MGEGENYADRIMKELEEETPYSPEDDQRVMIMCSICHEEKPLDEYHERKGGWMGRASICIECRSSIMSKTGFIKSLKEKERDR